MKVGVFVSVFFVLFLVCDGAKILCLFTSFGKSHLMVHMSVARTLIDRGHDVTVVTSQPLNDANPKYRHIKLNVPGLPREFIVGATTQSMSIPKRLYMLTSYSMSAANASIHDPQMQRLMQEETFDLVILGYFFNDHQIGVAAHFKCPYVIVFSNRPLKGLVDMLGNPREWTYVPHLILGKSQPLGFFDRIQNIGAHLFDLAVNMFVYYKQQHYYESNFPSAKYPSYKEMLANVSLILNNHHFTNGPIAPTVPAAIDIGGIQIKPKSDPLPEDIKTFLDGASTNGAVYLSLGSNARSADLPSDTTEKLYNVLSEVKQRVIWKWEDDTPPGNASNILFRKWLPQDDILAHPNIRLFITHGGLGSVVESEYHGVPMVGMPLFADQFTNMGMVQDAGYGLTLGKGELTVEKFRDAITEVLERPTYRNKVREFSRIYRDRPMGARETAAYWIEYVLRHRGAKHLQSPAVHMNFIQYYGLDVLGFLFSIMYIVFKVSVLMFKKIVCMVFSKVCKKKSVVNNNRKKKQ